MDTAGNDNFFNWIGNELTTKDKLLVKAVNGNQNGLIITRESDGKTIHCKYNPQTQILSIPTGKKTIQINASQFPNAPQALEQIRVAFQ